MNLFYNLNWYWFNIDLLYMYVFVVKINIGDVIDLIVGFRMYVKVGF